MSKKFQFRKFAVSHERSTLKVGTDSVLLAAAVSPIEGSTILDIGCGCGVILLCLAQKFQQCETISSQWFYGIDIDKDSVEEAKENGDAFPLLECQNLYFQRVSLQDFVQVSTQQFDLIVSNPPYFGHSLLSPKDRNRISKHRDDNLSFCELAVGVKALLAPNGAFFLILPIVEMKEFCQEMLNVGLKLFFDMEIIPVEGKSANRRICGFSHNQRPIVHKTLIIRQEDRTYHNDYKELTKDFYLRF